MNHISDKEKQQLEQLIIDCESRTSGEIVTVIANSSDSYWFIPTLWAMGLAMLTPAICYFAFPQIHLLWLFDMQLLSALLFSLLFRWQPIKMFLVPKKVQQQRARRMAHELFFMQDLHRKHTDNAILIFVSVAEHYVEVLADSAIDEKAPEGTWKIIIKDFVKHVKEGHIALGYQGAIVACGALLAEHFPSTNEKDDDQLPNHLIEL